jgi:uncharacterized coiled-coil protein SlyX
MSLKTENADLREQVARLTERLANVRKEEALQATITEMQTLAMSQQEQVEFLRKTIAKQTGVIEQHSTDMHRATEGLHNTINTQKREIDRMRKQIDTLTEDNRRLNDRLTEVSKVDL